MRTHLYDISSYRENCWSKVILEANAYTANQEMHILSTQKRLPQLMFTSSMLYSTHLVHITGIRESEMLTCYREDFLKLPSKFQLCASPGQLRGGQGKNTVHLGGTEKPHQVWQWDDGAQPGSSP